MALDPVSGAVQGSRQWGEISLSRENLLPFLYKLHYSLHIPDGFGLELGVLLFGVVAIVWCFDCLVALWLSFPSRRAWRKSLAFRWRAAATSSTSTCTAPAACGCGRCCWCWRSPRCR
ncbi:PepSY-associated TM region [compost metagenome]